MPQRPNKIAQFWQELDPDLPDSHFLNGIFSVWTDWNWVEGEKAFLKALAINPKHGFSISSKKESLLAMGEFDKAFEYRKIVLTRFFSEELIRSFDQIHKEQGYASHEPNMPYLATGFSGFTNLYDSARFISIVEKMNLPLPNK